MIGSETTAHEEVHGRFDVDTRETRTYTVALAAHLAGASMCASAATRVIGMAWRTTAQLPKLAGTQAGRYPIGSGTRRTTTVARLLRLAESADNLGYLRNIRVEDQEQDAGRERSGRGGLIHSSVALG